jgi:hypothetical protein
MERELWLRIYHELRETAQQIERAFGTAGSFAGSLGPLPRWVGCKLVTNAARILYRRQQKERLQSVV